MKKLLLLAIVCVLAMFGTLKAQDKEVVIDGTVGSYTPFETRCAPLFVAVQYSISQQYYTAEEIGMEAGYIKSLSFKTGVWYEDDARRLEVYMVNTEDATFNGLDMVQVTNEDKVFSGNVTFLPNSWATIEFDKYFNYTGGNVMVCVSDLTGDMCYYDGYFAGFNVPAEDGTRCLWNSHEAMFFDPTAKAITAKEMSTTVPSVKFVFTEEEQPEEPEEPEQPEQPEENANEVLIDGTVGSYTSFETRYAPIFVSVQYSISQQYYTAEEIGKEAGYIKSLSFKADMMWYEDDARRLEVYMINTEDATFNGLDMVQVTNEDKVFSGNVTFLPNSWATIEFDKYFNYTGGNVMVCVSDLTGDMCYYDGYFAGFNVPAEDGTRCLWNSHEAMFFDPTAKAITAKEMSTTVPSVKFVFTEEEQPGDAIEEATFSFNVYPNPVNNMLFVETESNVVEISVYDIFGRQQELSAISSQPSVIDVADLNSGVYFVKVVTENAEVVKRFIKK